MTTSPSTWVASLLVAVLFAPLPAPAQDPGDAPSPDRPAMRTTTARHFDMLPSLREAMRKYPSADERKAGEEPFEVPNFVNPNPLAENPLDGSDPVLQSPDPALWSDTKSNAASKQSLQSYDGLGNADNEQFGGRVTPPDPDLDVGENYVMEVVNLMLAVYDKSGNLVDGPYPNDVFFSGFGGDCEVENLGDPIVMHDDAAGRWIVSYMSFNVDGGDIPGVECVAVSATSDPTGSWYRYEFVISNDYFNDYPKLGVGEDAYYSTYNMFSSQAYQGVTTAAFERQAMLDGDPDAQMVVFGPDSGAFGLLPADVDGPVSGSSLPGYFLEFTQDQLTLYEMNVDWATPSNSTFQQTSTFATAPFDSFLCGASRGACIPQPNGQSLEAISDRLMQRLQLTDQGDHYSMVVNHTVDADGSGRAGVRWYELRDAGRDGSWTLHQQGTYAPADNLHRWMGAVAKNLDGSMLLWYTASGPSTPPSIRYTGRPPGAPRGTMTLPEQTVVQSPTSMEDAARWGDYSSVDVDPTNGRTFWAVHEHAVDEVGFANWDTRMAAVEPFDLDDTTAPGAVADLSAAAASGTEIELTWTAPADDAGDASSGPVLGYDVRYATSPISESNFGDATPVNTSLQPGDPGTSETLTVSGLDFSTEYYVAIRATDDNGNTSFSNVPSATTDAKPVFAYSPSPLSAELEVGNTTTKTLTISNEETSTSTLEYSFPAFASAQVVTSAPRTNDTTHRYPDGTLQSYVKGSSPDRTGPPVVLGAGGPDSYGYRWIDSNESGGPAYEWVDISSTGTPASLFDDDEETVNLPFTFSFYGNAKTSVSISSNGFLTFGENGGDIPFDEIPDVGIPNDFIMPYGADLNPSDGGTVYYQDMGDGRFIVQWTDVPFFGRSEAQTFQVILFESGRIRMQYRKTNFYSTDAIVGIEGPNGERGLQVAYKTSYLEDGLAISISTGPRYVSDVSPASGSLGGGQSENVSVTFDAGSMQPGSTSRRLGLATNDPSSADTSVATSLTVSAGPPAISVAPDTLDFGPQAVGATVTKTVDVANDGDPLDLTSVTTSDDAYTASIRGPTPIPYGDTAYVDVTFAPQSIRDAAATLTIESTDPDDPSVDVALEGSGAPAAGLSVSTTSTSATLAAGDTAQSAVTISNTGGVPLEVDVTFDETTGETTTASTARSAPDPNTGAEERTAAQGADRSRSGSTSPKSHTTEADSSSVIIQSSLPTVLDDPTGDSGNKPDVTALRTAVRQDTLIFELEFAETFQPSAIDGYLIMDTDQDSTTGDTEYNPGNPLGVEYGVQLRDVQYGNVQISATQDFKRTSPRAFVDSTKIRFGVPLSFFEDDGRFDLYGEVGDYNGVDVLPNDGVVNVRGLPWLRASPLRAVVDPGEDTTVTVTFDPDHTPTGTYTGDVQLRSNDPTAPVTDVSATLTVDRVPTEWLADLIVEEDGTAQDTLSIGQSALATDEEDALFAEATSGDLDTDTHAKMPDGGRTRVDVRPTTPNLNYLWWLQLQPGLNTESVTLRWSPDRLPDGPVRLVDAYGGDVVDVDMKSTDRVTISDLRATTLAVLHPLDGAAASSIRRVADEGRYNFGETYWSLRKNFGNSPNLVLVQRLDSGPDVQRDGSVAGISEANVSAYRWLVRKQGRSDLNGEMRIRPFEVPNNGLSDATTVAVYERDTLGVGFFSELYQARVDDLGDLDRTNDVLYFEMSDWDQQGGELVLASDTDPLPVEMAGFTGTVDENDVRLEWTTASETNNAGFAVQRRDSETGQFEQVGFVDGSGTTDEATTYRFVDSDVPFAADSLTYRLEQVDASGKKSLSDPVTVERPAPSTLTLHAPYPNPARQRVTLRYELAEAGPVRVDLYNLLGQRVATLADRRHEPGRIEQTLDLDRWASGTYFVRITTAEEARTQRLVIVQ